MGRGQGRGRDTRPTCPAAAAPETSRAGAISRGLGHRVGGASEGRAGHMGCEESRVPGPVDVGPRPPTDGAFPVARLHGLRRARSGDGRRVGAVPGCRACSPRRPHREVRSCRTLLQKSQPSLPREARMRWQGRRWVLGMGRGGGVRGGQRRGRRRLSGRNPWTRQARLGGTCVEVKGENERLSGKSFQSRSGFGRVLPTPAARRGAGSP